MTLRHDMENYIAEKDLDQANENNYRRSVRFFGEFLGRDATREDLTEPTLNRWLKFVAEIRSPFTVLGHRRSITILWNWLSEQRLVESYDPRRLRQIKVEHAPPRVWSVPQVRLLLSVAAGMPGQLRSGILASELLTAMIMLGYASGLRLKDQLRIRRTDLDGTVLNVVQNKTGNPHSIDVGEDVFAVLRPLLAIESEYLLPVSRRTLRTWVDKLFSRAEAQGFNRKHRQGIGNMRKVGATEVARKEGLEAAARYLGHVGGTEIARRNYVAREALGATPKPPRLFDVGADRSRAKSA